MEGKSCRRTPTNGARVLFAARLNPNDVPENDPPIVGPNAAMSSVWRCEHNVLFPLDQWRGRVPAG